MSTKTTRIAMLIDADNAQATLLEKVLAETSRYGLLTVRRAYGDWTSSNLCSWKAKLLSSAIHPIQQFPYTVGKNATDSAMIIDAMDILYSKTVEGFCIVSSDSDYTRLAIRIREAGLFIMGIGKLNTPKAFVNACEVFVYTENLCEPSEKPASEPQSGVIKQGDPSRVLTLLKTAFGLAAGDETWACLSPIGSHLRQLDPGFDSRTYGYAMLSMLIRAFPDTFEVKGQNGTGTLRVRMKHNLSANS